MSDQPAVCVRCGGPFGDQETPGRTGQGEPCHARTLTCVEVLRERQERSLRLLRRMDEWIGWAERPGYSTPPETISHIRRDVRAYLATMPEQEGAQP